jgi:predicted phosphodiesterase
MRIAILSDLHANLPALEATLADVEEQDPDAVYCLGDLVGYAPWPNEVVEAIRSRRIPTLAGNYDEGVGNDSGDCGCAYRTEGERLLGDQSIAFTNRVVTPATRAYLRALPRHIAVDLGDDRQRYRVLLVHGSPRKINEYLFEERPDRGLLRLLEEAGADALICGHTHKPYSKRLESSGEGGAHHRHVVNAGSVGKPKDGDPRACWVLLELPDRPRRCDPGALTVTFRRVLYDVEKAARTIEQSPLPDSFAQALRTAG